MRNSRTTHRQTWITAHRVVILALIMAAVVMLGLLLARPKASESPTVSEIAQAVNGPTTFERPSHMDYVAKTNSCIAGGTVTSSVWHVGSKTVPVGQGDSNAVDYTAFVFQTDDGQVFTVSDNGALFTEAGENLGLELYCDPQSMTTAKSFGMIAIIWGGK